MSAPYRPPPPPPDPYPRAWARLRRRRAFVRIRTGLALAYVTQFTCCANVSWPTTFALAVFGVAFAAMSMYPALCPRCGGRFYRRWPRSASELGVSDRCACCGIAIGTTRAEADAASHARGTPLV